MGSQTYGNPTVADGRVYVGTNNDGRDDPRFEGDYSLLRCLDEETGEVLWTLTVPKLGAGKVSDWEYLGICSSPAIDGDRAYVVTNLCEVVCLDVNGLSDGNDGFQKEGTYMAGPPEDWDSAEPVELDEQADADIIWRYDMRDELGVFPHNITSTSPLVLNDKVYAATSNGMDWSHTNTPNPRAPALIALDKKTGELVGEEASGISQRMLHSNWSSPAYGKVDGKGMIFFGGGDGRLYAFNPEPVEENGFGILEEQWRYDVNPDRYREVDYPRPEGPSEIIATAVFHKGKVYVPIGQDPEHGTGQGNLACVDAKTGEEVWTFEELDRSISTVAVHNGLVYATDYTGFIYCLDVDTGEQYWQHDTLSHMWGSPFVADGKLYVGNEDGDLLIFQAGREKNLLNTVNMWDPIYSSPIAANGKLIVATQTQLYAIEKDAEPVSE
jgi:outer membrane protein assembly factor BamB